MSGGDWKELLVAVQDGDFDLVKYHVANDIDLNYQHPEIFTTLLIESIVHNHYDIATYLLENGADPTLRAGLSNDSPLSEAKKTGNKKMIRLIKSYLPKRKFLFFRW